jgi:hypothetical protein
MSLPKQYSLMYAPILNFLSDGAPHKRKEIKDSLIAVFSLTLDEQIMQTGRRGIGIFDNKVNDALFYLIKTGMVESNDTIIFKITNLGMELWNMKLRVIDDDILTKHGNGFRILNKQQDPANRLAPGTQKKARETGLHPSRSNTTSPKSSSVPTGTGGIPIRSADITVVKKDLDFRKIINTSRQGPWRQRVERVTETYGSRMSVEEMNAIKRVTKNKDKNLPLGSEDVKVIYVLFEKLYVEEGKKLLAVLFIDEKGQDVSPDV